MRPILLSFVLTLVVLHSFGCSIAVREDMLLSEPHWELAETSRMLPAAEKDMFDDAHCQVDFATTGNRARAATGRTGLEKLADQVLHRKVVINRTVASASLLTNDSSETTPLPEELADHPFTRAIARTILAEYNKLGVVKVCEGDKLIDVVNLVDDGMWNRILHLPDKNISNLWAESLSRTEFKKLGTLLATTGWKTLRGQSLKTASFAPTDQGKVKWAELFTGYLMAYYTGSYVNRYGTKYDKPALEFPITNAVVVALANIFQESILDYVLLDTRDVVQDPIVYDKWDASTLTPKGFLNGNAAEPTFSLLLRQKKVTSGGDAQHPVNLPGVLEIALEPKTMDAASKDPTPKGLTKQEVCVIQYAAGLSGEASQGLSSLIIRSLGGGNLGFVVGYGKFSIGDHETLMKLIEASVETFSKRSADLLFSHLIYNVRYEQVTNAGIKTQEYKPTLLVTRNDAGAQPSTSKIDWDWLQQHLNLAKLLGCLDKAAPSA